MIKRIKSLTNTEDKKRLLSNFFSLSILQGANYILPLITLPYLVRVLGVEYFGLLAFANATIAYFNILTDYGFNLTATREISIHRDNKVKVTEIFSSVMTIKVILMFVSFLLLTILVFSFEKFHKDALVYFLTFGTVVGQVLFPVWFFQGMEKMKYITYLNILAKSIFTVAIFIFVTKQSDFWIVPLLTSIGFIIAGIWSLYLVRKEFGIQFTWQKTEHLKFYTAKAHSVFGSTVLSTIISSFSVLMLGFFSTNYNVGIYSAIEKIAKAILSISNMSTQALYPFISKKMKYSNVEGIYFLKNIFKYEFGFFLVVTIVLSLCGDSLLRVLYGTTVSQHANLLTLLLIWVLLCVINKYLGNLYLFSLGYFNLYLKDLFIASLLAGTAYIILIPSMVMYGIVYGMIIGELVLLIGMIFHIRKLNKKVK